MNFPQLFTSISVYAILVRVRNMVSPECKRQGVGKVHEQASEINNSVLMEKSTELLRFAIFFPNSYFERSPQCLDNYLAYTTPER
jgi:hypothetical protein